MGCTACVKCMFCVLFPVLVFVFFGGFSDRAYFFKRFNCVFFLEHVQRITFCRCFLIFNPAVFCVDDGVNLRLKIKNPTTTTTTTTLLLLPSKMRERNVDNA